MIEANFRVSVAFICMIVSQVIHAEVDLEDQNHRFESRLSSALQEYESVRTQISSDKIPLVKTINEKKLKIGKLRSEIDTLLLQQSQRKAQLDRNETLQLDISKQIEFIQALVLDHLSNFESLTTISEDQIYRSDLKNLRSRSESDDTLPDLRIMDLSLDRIKKALGGYAFSGKAVDETGAIHSGLVSLIGPTSYFHSTDGPIAGQLKLSANSLLPSISASPSIEPELLKDLEEGKIVSMPIDPTLGKASGFDQTKWSLSEHIRKGGYVGYVIMGFAFIALIIVILKFYDLSRVRTAYQPSTVDIIASLKSGDVKTANDLAAKQNYPSNLILSAAVARANEDRAVLEEVVIGEIQNVRDRLERFLPFLAITAATSPLMGLLGTVVGMIKTFALITVFGAGEAKFFSSGISEALVTTEFGLIVAIPSLIMHGILQRAVREKVASLEEVASDFVIELHSS